MQHRCRLGALGLVGALAFTLQAAAITVDGCDFLFLAKRSMSMENGSAVITLSRT